MRIIVGGFLGIIPAGGVTWDYIQYPLGLSLLGHDVYYVEDTRLYPIYQKAGSNWDDSSSCINHLKQVMTYFGMNDKWAYRDEATGKVFGLTEKKIKEICVSADVFINISCSTFLRDEYLKIPARILIDTDPMFTQIQYLSQQMFTPGRSTLREMINGHNYLFTFGENIGARDCKIPDCGLRWLPTRQPVALNYWKTKSNTSASHNSFTTLMNWTAGKTLLYENELWGQKDLEFNKIMNLPARIDNVKLSIVVNQTGGTAPTFSKSAVENAGWKILNPDLAAGNWLAYQKFIQDSSGEFSVAKQTYVKANTGWFPCRSACYLATGKPVVTQETGWSRFIPQGLGLLAFTDIESAAANLMEVINNPHKHIKAARNIAEEYFNSDKVLTRLLSYL